MTIYSVDKLIAQARRLAVEYRRATGKPLPGISSEISQHDAMRLMDLEPAPAGAGGYHAVGRGARQGKRIQIKGRAIFEEGKAGQRIGQLNVDQTWDSVMLVLLDEEFEPVEIYEADREDLLTELNSASSRSKRGAMSVAKFKHVGRLVWTREEGVRDDGIWDNQALSP